MKRHSLFALAVVSAAGALFTACSKESSSGVTSLAGLPTATGPVVSGSRSLSSQPATRSKKLKEWGDSSWSGNSGPMCQTGEMIMRMLSDASNPDKILCYVGAMEANGLFTASYDGSNKYYNLNGAPGRSRGDMKIKFNITKTGGAITDFKMWMCSATRGSRVPTQSEYVSTSLSNGVATVTSVGKFSGSLRDSYSGAQRTVATGNFNSDGAWTSKTITNTGVFSGTFGGSASEHKQHLTLTQGSDNFVLSGYFNGYHGGATYTQSGAMYAKVAGVNLANLDTAALGDGSAKYSFSFYNPGDPANPYSYSDTKSWDGTTFLSATGSDANYYNTVSAQTLPTQAAISSPDWDTAGGEEWDCNSEGQTPETIDLAAAFASISDDIAVCDTKYGFSENSPVGCSAAAF